MYLSYYSLQKEPFHITPDPDFLFLNESHKEALGSLIYGIEKRKGFIAITGGIGLGKTTIVRSYLEKKDDGHFKIIYVFNANITFKELLKTVFRELSLEDCENDVFEMVNCLHLALIHEYEGGNNVVIIIDEAQNMPVETLENLRMLSNLETSNDKLIQIVFVGQQEFDALLERQELRQLKQRIAIRTSIQPLNHRESHEYVNHRLSLAGLKDGPIFTLAAMERIVREAKGVPRTINILCDNALITGFGLEQKPVGLKVVREVISDFKGAKLRRVKWPYLTATALLLALFTVFSRSSYREGFSKWIHEDLFSVDTQPEAVRIPIKPEPVTPEQLRNAARSDSHGVSQSQIREDAEQSSGTQVLQTGEQGRAEPQAEQTRPMKSKTISGASAGFSPAMRHGTRSVEKKAEADAASKPVDVAKDVDDRLLHLIKEGGPGIQPGGDEGISP